MDAGNRTEAAAPQAVDEVDQDRRRLDPRTGKTIGQHDPIRLSTAARIAFPDGSVTETALRAAMKSGQLSGFKMNGKFLTTLHDIERFIDLCRVNPRAPDCGIESPDHPSQDVTPNRASTSSSATDAKLAQDTALMIARRLKQGSRNT